MDTCAEIRSHAGAKYTAPSKLLHDFSEMQILSVFILLQLRMCPAFKVACYQKMLDFFFFCTFFFCVFFLSGWSDQTGKIY